MLMMYAMWRSLSYRITLACLFNMLNNQHHDV